jgi:hypothetical protein
MTNEQPHQEHAQDAFIDALFEQSPINIAALLRACADGELTPEQCKRLDAVLKEHPGVYPDAEAQHDFEEKLRACCGRAMTRPCCPGALRDRISAMTATAAAGGVTTADVPPTDTNPDGIEQASTYTRDRSFWARSPLLGLAAVVLLSVAGVLIWQSTGLRQAHPGGSIIEPVAYTESMGRFVLSEHTRCCFEEAAQAKFSKHDIQETVGYFSEQFDRPVQLPDMSQVNQRIEYYGGGDCHVPMTSVSGHLRFDAYDDNNNPISLSLFIAPDPGMLPLEEGVTYRLNSKACEEAGAQLFVWLSDGVQYVLVSEASDDTCASVRSIMNAPERLSSI